MKSGKAPTTIQPMKKIAPSAQVEPSIEQCAQRQDDPETADEDHHRPAPEPIRDSRCHKARDRRGDPQRSDQAAHGTGIEASHVDQEQGQERETDHQVRDQQHRDQDTQQDVPVGERLTQ